MKIDFFVFFSSNKKKEDDDDDEFCGKERKPEGKIDDDERKNLNEA